MISGIKLKNMNNAIKYHRQRSGETSLPGVRQKNNPQRVNITEPVPARGYQHEGGGIDLGVILPSDSI